MRTAAQRIAKYNARMVSSLVDPVLSAVNSQASANFLAYLANFYPNQLALRAILNDEDVPIIQYAPYEAFHGELFHLSQSFAGPALQTAFCNLVAKWMDTAHLGAGAEAILTRIGVDVYHLDACGTP
jgi:hypothetical protein